MGRLRRLTKQWTHFWQVTGKSKPCCHTPQRLAGQLPTCQQQVPYCASLSTAVRLHTPNPAQPRSGAVPIKRLEKIHSVLPFFQLAPCWLQLASATPSSSEQWSVQKAPSTKRAPFLKAEGWAISKCCSTSWILPETWLLFSNHPSTPWLRLHTRMCMHTHTHTYTHACTQQKREEQDFLPPLLIKRFHLNWPSSLRDLQDGSESDGGRMRQIRKQRGGLGGRAPRFVISGPFEHFSSVMKQRLYYLTPTPTPAQMKWVEQVHPPILLPRRWSHLLSSFLCVWV